MLNDSDLALRQRLLSATAQIDSFNAVKLFYQDSDLFMQLANTYAQPEDSEEICTWLYACRSALQQLQTEYTQLQFY